MMPNVSGMKQDYAEGVILFIHEEVAVPRG
jgi:hypothetical protein